MRVGLSFADPETKNPAPDHLGTSSAGLWHHPRLQKHQMCLHSAIVPDEESTLAWVTLTSSLTAKIQTGQLRGLVKATVQSIGFYTRFRFPQLEHDRHICNKSPHRLGLGSVGFGVRGCVEDGVATRHPSGKRCEAVRKTPESERSIETAWYSGTGPHVGYMASVSLT